MIIVTGGAGFIGSNLVKALNERSINDILIVDNLEKSGKHKNLNTLEFTDYCDKRDFFNKIENLKGLKIEAVFHQGACSDTMETNGRYMMENNYEFSKLLLEFCIRNNSRFIYASSASVYGDGKKGFKESRNFEYPLNIYAYSKFLFDQYVRKLLHNSPIQIAGLRYFNVYGSQETHKGRMASTVFQFHNQILKDGIIRLFEGSENFKRDFIFVQDVVDVNLYFFGHPEKSGIFNCGTGRAESFLKIAETMKGLYKKNVQIQFVPFPEELEGKYQAFTEADLSNLRQAGFVKDFTSMVDGIRAYVRVLNENGGYFK